MLTLKAENRTELGKKSKKLAEEGKLAAVLYGKKEDTVHITLDSKEFEKTWKEAGESTVIAISGIGDDKEVLIHDVDFEPVFGGIRHVDLYAIEKGKKVQVNVSLDFVGEAGAEKVGGVLNKVLHELEIEALAKDLPHNITIDISVLTDIGSSIHVKDVVLPEGVTAITGEDEAVISVSLAKEEEEEPVEAPDLENIEVEQKGKGEEETEGESTSTEE